MLVDYGDVAYDAITLRQPHAYAITHLGCRIVNRDWPTWRVCLGRMIAIHAGAALDEAADIELPKGYATRAIVAVARVAAVVDGQVGGLRAGLAAAGVDVHAQERWITGPTAIALDRVRVLPRPVGAGGALYCWLMTDGVRLQVARQLRELDSQEAVGG